MKPHPTIDVKPDEIPTIPLRSNSPELFKKWQQLYRVRLRIQFEIYDSNTPDELSHEQFCQRVFMHARWATEPQLN
jgi:hypothetical protein